MKRKRRILRRWHDDGTVVVILHHDERAGDVYTIEKSGTPWGWVGSIDEAKVIAEKKLKTENRHQCSDRCSDWTPIPQPEPLSEGQKKIVVLCFRAFEKSIVAGESHETQLKALQNEYTGHSSHLVDDFDDAPDAGQALKQTKTALRIEIEDFYWREFS